MVSDRAQSLGADGSACTICLPSRTPRSFTRTKIYRALRTVWMCSQYFSQGGMVAVWLDSEPTLELTFRAPSWHVDLPEFELLRITSFPIATVPCRTDARGVAHLGDSCHYCCVRLGRALGFALCAKLVHDSVESEGLSSQFAETSGELALIEETAKTLGG